MNKIESLKYIYPISPSATPCYSVGDILPIEILWERNGKMYNRKQEKGGLCAILLEHDNVAGVVENPYTGGFNLAHVLNGVNQVVWDVPDSFIATYGNLHYGRTLHFVDVGVEDGILCSFTNISNYGSYSSINVKTGEIG